VTAVGGLLAWRRICGAPAENETRTKLCSGASFSHFQP
jgi:hypothetical protein